jgi:hypothetical protein|tara:strand:+ start:1067 stop:1402 length:336 start_codon:yes stop_codon:yes gene_type:complete
MSNDKYPKSTGSLHTNDFKKQNNHPDWTGEIEISSDQLKNIIAMGRAGEKPKLKLAAWNRKAKETGKEYFYLSAEAKFDGNKVSAPPPEPDFSAVASEPEPIATAEDDWPF